MGLTLTNLSCEELCDLMCGKQEEDNMGSIGNSSNTSTNTFLSSFGFANVGTQETFTTMSGVSTKGTVIPQVEDIQQYLDSGKFDNYGNNDRAKKMIINDIIRDMSGRGYDVVSSEDGVKFLPGGETGLTISLGRRNGRWVVRRSTSSGSTSRSGMRGALDRISRRQ